VRGREEDVEGQDGDGGFLGRAMVAVGVAVDGCGHVEFGGGRALGGGDGEDGGAVAEEVVGEHVAESAPCEPLVVVRFAAF